MSKIDTINEYLSKCDDVLEKNNFEKKEELVREIKCVYESEIPRFTTGLRITSPLKMYEPYSDSESTTDIKHIKAMLVNYRDNIEDGFITKDGNIQTINVSSNSNSESSVNVNISIENVIKEINNLPEETLDSEDKNELDDLIKLFQSAINSKDNEKINKKLTKLMNFALEKGPAVVALVSSAVSLFKDQILSLF